MQNVQQVKCSISDIKAIPVFVLGQNKVYTNYRVEYVRVNEKLECISTETESALESTTQARFHELLTGEFYLVILMYPEDKDGNKRILWQQDLEDHFKAIPDTEIEGVSAYLLDAKDKLRKKFGLVPTPVSTCRGEFTKIVPSEKQTTLKLLKSTIFTSEEEEDSDSLKPASNQLPPIPTLPQLNAATGDTVSEASSNPLKPLKLS